MVVHTQDDKLLPQLLMDRFDTLPSLKICMKKFDYIFFFCQNDRYVNVDNFLFVF